MVAAIGLPLRLRFRRRMDRDLAQEIDALEREAVCSAFEARTRELSFDLDAARRVTLYRALFVELAHLTTFAEQVECPGHASETAWKSAWSAFLARPPEERERISRERGEVLGAALREREAIPFGRLLDPGRLAEDGLERTDFSLAPA